MLNKALKIAGLLAIVQAILFMSLGMYMLFALGKGLSNASDTLKPETVTSVPAVPEPSASLAPGYTPEECKNFMTEPDSAPAECKSRGPR